PVLAGCAHLVPAHSRGAHPSSRRDRGDFQVGIAQSSGQGEPQQVCRSRVGEKLLRVHSFLARVTAVDEGIEGKAMRADTVERRGEVVRAQPAATETTFLRSADGEAGIQEGSW